jgi:hypothetical protein
MEYTEGRTEYTELKGLGGLSPFLLSVYSVLLSVYSVVFFSLQDDMTADKAGTTCYKDCVTHLTSTRKSTQKGHYPQPLRSQSSFSTASAFGYVSFMYSSYSRSVSMLTCSSVPEPLSAKE